MPFSFYQYKATVIRVIDGDTAWLRIAGAASKDWLTQHITGKTLYVVSMKLDKYGRPLVTLYDPETTVAELNQSINQQMLNLGLAVPLAD